MPVRSLSSSVFKWPDGETVARAAREWAQRVGAENPDVIRIGYFGSYARGDWGVGSDLDLILILERVEAPFAERAASWNVAGLPVPAEVLVYAETEWEGLAGGRFRETVNREAVWVYERPVG